MTHHNYLAYTFIGYNYTFGHNHLKIENSSANVLHVAKLSRSIRYTSAFGYVSPFEDLIIRLTTS